MIYGRTRKVKSFFFGQYFADGLKMTFGILLPSLIFSRAGELEIGITLSLGAFCVSIADSPGPVVHKRNGMLCAGVFMFITAFLTGIVHEYPWLLALEIPAFCFFFAMLSIYGDRASAVGTAALLIMILTIDQRIMETSFFEHAFYILGGGLWYMLLSLGISGARPYRLGQQALGECIIEVAAYLRLKAGFFDDKTSIENQYKKLILQQVAVNEQQDKVREILFKTRKMVKESMKGGRLLIMIFVDIIDLFEQAMSTHYDYATIRQRFLAYNILPSFKETIVNLALELDNLGYALINNEKPRPSLQMEPGLVKLKKRLDDLEAEGVPVLILKRILINIRSITIRLENIYKYFHDDKLTFLSKTKETDLSKFVSHQQFDWKIFQNNLTLKSTAFRHSLRLAIACLFGYIISLGLYYGEHSYWILLTILVILRPGFSLSKQRNYERVIGTVAGGLIGVFILTFIQDETVKFLLMLLFMVLTYTFLRIKYVVSVLFMTPFILIVFSFIYRSSNLDVAQERVIDTFLGSAIALIASYFIFPSWESYQFRAYLSAILKANLNYLQKIASRLGARPCTITDYKLARKEVYVETANLASAFQRMLNEPKSKQADTGKMHKFVVLNHILSSYLATLSSSISQAGAAQAIDPEQLKLIRRTKFLLKKAIKNIDETPVDTDFEMPDALGKVDQESPDSLLSREQLGLINKVSADIEKLSKVL